MPRRDWTRDEVELAVADHFAMFEAELVSALGSVSRLLPEK